MSDRGSIGRRLPPAPAPFVACDAYFANCKCHRPLTHEGAHDCKCGGSWEGSDGEAGGITAIHSYPDVTRNVGPAL